MLAHGILPAVHPEADTAPPARLAAAAAPRAFQSERLLVLDPASGRYADYDIRQLPRFFGSGDVVVVNDAATLPASLRVDAELELRLVAAEADGSFRAVTFGRGDFRDPTEARAVPRALRTGERLVFSPELAARVLEIDSRHPRLLRLGFETSGARLFSALYRHGKPIQYSYAPAPLALWDVQNRYASRPWAFELPSAGHPLTFDALFEIEGRGAALAYVTHAASISSTGDAALDARLPLAERYEIGEDAAQSVTRAVQRGSRVIAVGTSVVRALEAASDEHGRLRAGSDSTTLRLGPSSALRVTSGLLSGLHEPGTSHFELLTAFAPRDLVERAAEHAARAGYTQHEFGDACLLLPGSLSGA